MKRPKVRIPTPTAAWIIKSRMRKVKLPEWAAFFVGRGGCSNRHVLKIYPLEELAGDDLDIVAQFRDGAI